MTYTIKGQALTNFIGKFTYSNKTKVARTTNIAEATNKVEMERNEVTAKMLKESDLQGKQCVLYVDRASNENRSGAGMMLVSPEEYNIHCVLHFGFQASNNEAK